MTDQSAQEMQRSMYIHIEDDRSVHLEGAGSLPLTNQCIGTRTHDDQ